MLENRLFTHQNLSLPFLLYIFNKCIYRQNWFFSIAWPVACFERGSLWAYCAIIIWTLHSYRNNASVTNNRRCAMTTRRMSCSMFTSERRRKDYSIRAWFCSKSSHPFYPINSTINIEISKQIIFGKMSLSRLNRFAPHG